jgi:hypothetical protein
MRREEDVDLKNSARRDYSAGCAADHKLKQICSRYTR